MGKNNHVRSYSYKDKDLPLFEWFDALPRRYTQSEVVLSALHAFKDRFEGTDEITRDLDIHQDDDVWKEGLKNTPNENLKKLSDRVDKKKKLLDKELKKRIG